MVLTRELQPTAADRAPGTRLREACRIIEREFATPLTTQRLARRLRLPRLVFYQTFRDAYGVTPDEYLRFCRLREAARLLDAGHAEGEVATMVGYVQQRLFAADFRREFRQDDALLGLLRQPQAQP